jgi:hypothetical protein
MWRTPAASPRGHLDLRQLSLLRAGVTHSIHAQADLGLVFELRGKFADFAVGMQLGSLGRATETKLESASSPG